MTNTALGKRTRAPLLAVALALVLTGCSMFGEPNEVAVGCPTTGVLADGERLERYRPNSDHDLTDLTIKARVGNIRNACSIRKDERLLEMDMIVQVYVERGPASEVGAPLPLEYFAAVTDNERNVLTRQLFQLAATFEGTARQAIFDEELFLTIPIPEGKSVRDYQIVVGLQLTREELNRAEAAKTKRR